jgi:hypothetical protein
MPATVSVDRLHAHVDPPHELLDLAHEAGEARAPLLAKRHGNDAGFRVSEAEDATLKIAPSVFESFLESSAPGSRLAHSHRRNPASRL